MFLEFRPRVQLRKLRLILDEDGQKKEERYFLFFRYLYDRSVGFHQAEVKSCAIRDGSFLYTAPRYGYLTGTTTKLEFP